MVAITQSVGARGGGALSEDDKETGEGNGENQSDVGPSHVGQADPGEAARNGADNADASVAPMEQRAGHSHSDHSEQSAGKARSGDARDCRRSGQRPVEVRRHQQQIGVRMALGVQRRQNSLTYWLVMVRGWGPLARDNIAFTPLSPCGFVGEGQV